MGLLLLGGGALVPIAEAHHDVSLVVGGIVTLAAVGLFAAMPLRWLPGTALILTLLIPGQSTLFPKSLTGAAFGVVPLAVWMIRAPRAINVPPRSLRVLAVLFGAWLIFSEVFAPLHTSHGWQWFVTAALAVVFAVTSTPSGLEPRSFRALFLAIATILGAYAVLEGVVLHRNVLFGGLLEHTIWWRSIEHGVSYRATTLLGHPLVNGTVFSAAGVLAASELLRTRRITALALIRLAILAGAVLATQSRGATIALAAGIAAVIILNPGRQSHLAGRRLALTLAFVVGAALLLVGLHTRNASSEGQSSASTRVVDISRAAQTVAGLEPFGAGPGESDEYRSVNQLPGSQNALENSYAQLAVSLGPIGALLMVTVLLSVVAVGMRDGAVIGETAALLAILIDIAGYNAIESDARLLVLIALFVIAIISGRRSPQLHLHQPGEISSAA